MPDTPNSRARFVILISGHGSNMQAIVQACQAGRCGAEVVAVLASRTQAAGVAWAAGAGIGAWTCETGGDRWARSVVVPLVAALVGAPMSFPFLS